MASKPAFITACARSSIRIGIGTPDSESALSTWRDTSAVPFVEDDDVIFLKTIIPSRKITRLYLGSGMQ